MPLYQYWRLTEAKGNWIFTPWNSANSSNFCLMNKMVSFHFRCKVSSNFGVDAHKKMCIAMKLVFLCDLKRCQLSGESKPRVFIITLSHQNRKGLALPLSLTDGRVLVPLTAENLKVISNHGIWEKCFHFLPERLQRPCFWPAFLKNAILFSNVLFWKNVGNPETKFKVEHWW